MAQIPPNSSNMVPNPKKYGLGLPDNHSEVPMASKLVVVPILTLLAIYIYTYGTKWAQWAANGPV